MVAGRSFLNFIWPEDTDLTQAWLDAAAAKGNLNNFENRYRHKDGLATVESFGFDELAGTGRWSIRPASR